MKVNLCSGSQDLREYTEKYLNEFNLQFNQFIESLIKQNSLQGASLLLPVTYRNTYVSPIFEDFVILFTLQKLLDNQDSFDEIILNNEALYNAVCAKKEFQNKKITFKRKLSELITLKKIRFFLFLIYHYLYSRLFSSFSLKNIQDKECTVIEVFLSDNSIQSKELVDHYYPDLKDKLTYEELTNLIFLPTLLEVSSPLHLMQLSRAMKKSDLNFFLPESEISISHYFEIIRLYKESSKKIASIPDFSGFETKEIVIKRTKESLYKRSNLFSFLRYRYFLRSNDFNSKHKFILWNENHGPDKSVCLAFSGKMNKPNIEGHHGFIPAREKNAYVPLKIELELNAFPKTIRSLCWDYNNYQHLNLQYLKAPAFRFQKLFKKYDIKEKKHQIFVGLPLNKSSFYSALLFLEDFLRTSDISLIFRPHPLTSKKDFVFLKNKFPKSTINQGEYIEELACSKLFLTAGGTALSYESIFLGTSSIIISSEFTQTNSNLFSDLGYVSFVKTPEDLKKLILKPHKISDDKLKDFFEFFEEPNDKNTREFLFD